MGTAVGGTTMAIKAISTTLKAEKQCGLEMQQRGSYGAVHWLNRQQQAILISISYGWEFTLCCIIVS